MTVTKVKPGDVLEIGFYIGAIPTGIRKWTVTRIYPYHVMAVCGNERQCFSVGELVELGLENGHNRPFKKSYHGGTAGKTWRWAEKG